MTTSERERLRAIIDMALRARSPRQHRRVIDALEELLSDLERREQ